MKMNLGELVEHLRFREADRPYLRVVCGSDTVALMLRKRCNFLEHPIDVDPRLGWDDILCYESGNEALVQYEISFAAMDPKESR